jgi:hypothetical protein
MEEMTVNCTFMPREALPDQKPPQTGNRDRLYLYMQTHRIQV